MSLRSYKAVKFAEEIVSWQEGELKLPFIIITNKTRAKVLQTCKPVVWSFLQAIYGEALLAKFEQTPIPGEVFVQYTPWREPILHTIIPPLCDGTLNEVNFSIKWMSTDNVDLPVPEYTQVLVNRYEESQVTEYYIMQTNVRRVEEGENVVNNLTSYRILLYTSNY